MGGYCRTRQLIATSPFILNCRFPFRRLSVPDSWLSCGGVAEDG